MKNVVLKTLDYFLRIHVHVSLSMMRVSQICPNATVTLGLLQLNPKMAFTLKLDLIRFEMWS